MRFYKLEENEVEKMIAEMEAREGIQPHEAIMGEGDE
jgi:hypothetical protein